MVARLIVSRQVIVMRHSLYALRGQDVMVAKFEQVAWITFALLAFVVGAMVGLNTIGIAQVHASNFCCCLCSCSQLDFHCYRFHVITMWHHCHHCILNPVYANFSRGYGLASTLCRRTVARINSEGMPRDWAYESTVSSWRYCRTTLKEGSRTSKQLAAGCQL